MLPRTKHKLCYRLVEGGSLDQWIETLDLNIISRTTDEFFDTQNGTFFKRGIFIKLRNSHLLEISANPTHITEDRNAGYTIRDYHFPVPFDPHKMETFHELEGLIGLKRPHPFLFAHFLGCNKLRSLITLDKIRKTYRTATAHLITIAVDQFSGLGTIR